MIQLTPGMEAKLQEWQGILKEASESGLSKREWCRQNGIQRNSLFYWQRRIKEAEEVRQSEHVFCELKPFAEDTHADPEPEPQSPSFQAHMMISTGRYHIYVDDSFNSDALSRVLSVIRDD